MKRPTLCVPKNGDKRRLLPVGQQREAINFFISLPRWICEAVKSLTQRQEVADLEAVLVVGEHCRGEVIAGDEDLGMMPKRSPMRWRGQVGVTAAAQSVESDTRGR